LNAQEDQEFEQFLREKADEAWRDLKFPATLFKRMLGADGGYRTAVKLLMDKNPSKGFTDLLMRGRPDLTVEAVVVESKWRVYFDPVLVKKAENLLRKSGYSFTAFSASTPVELPTTVDVGQPNTQADESVHQTPATGAGLLQSKDSVFDDLDLPFGSPALDRVSRLINTYQRDPKIRRAVLYRADGKCEYCGTPGFEMPDGSRYLEAHHIIGLAQNGPDTMQNVIALCPYHHKEAHYGLHAEVLERKFQEMLLSKT
jgi:hypothetical protein